MKCKRCGNEMKIKPVEIGKDKQGNPIYNTYAFCYDCKMKVNLDKQREQGEEKDGRKSSNKSREKIVKKKKKRNSIGLPVKFSGKKKKSKAKEKKGHGFLKFIFFLLILAILGTAAYYNRETLKKWVKQGNEKLNEEKEKDIEKEKQIKDFENEQIQEKDVKEKETEEKNQHAGQTEEENGNTENPMQEDENTLDKGEE